MGCNCISDRIGVILMALSACISNSAVGQTVVGSTDTWITNSDYPADAIKNLEQGLVNLRYDIEADGSVSKCKIVYATTSERLASNSCSLIQNRARYSPAYNQKGEAITGEDTAIIRWSLSPEIVKIERPFGGSIPRNNPGTWTTDLDYNIVAAAAGTSDVGIEYVIDTSGRISSCKIYQTSGDTKLDNYTCALVASRARFNQPTDVKGQPMITFGKSLIHWQKAKS